MKFSHTSLLRSAEQIRAEMKISLPYEDTKIFLGYERDYLSTLYAPALLRYRVVMSEVERRKADPLALTREFEEIRDSLRPLLAQTKGLSSLRSSTFFPAGKKRSDQAFRLQSLEDKVASLSIGKFCQLMDPGKFDSRFNFTKPMGDTELRNPQSSVYQSLLSKIDAIRNSPIATGLFQNFVDTFCAVVNNASEDYDNPQEIRDGCNRFYGLFNQLMAGPVVEPGE
jgi:hypothetical protein